MVPCEYEIWTYEGQKAKGLRVFYIYYIRGDGSFAARRTPFVRETGKIAYQVEPYLKPERLVNRISPYTLGVW